MESSGETGEDVVEIISNLLQSRKYKEALAIPKDVKYKQNFLDNCWDLIPVIVDKIQDETAVIEPSLQRTCEELLSIIIESANSEETLLEFIEQIDIAKNDAQFITLLNSAQQLLIKLTIKRGNSLQWCFHSISTYIERIPVPEYTLEGTERLLLDSDDNIRRILKIYSFLPSFYAPFVKELSSGDENTATKPIITAFLISLLGKPMINIDIDPNANPKSEAMYCFEQILKDICFLEKDILKLLAYVESYKRSSRIKSKTDVGVSLSQEQEEKLNMTALAGLYYGVWSGHFDVPEYAVPQVYRPEYIVQTVLRCVVHLLDFTEFGPLSKAIDLFKGVFKKLSYPASFNLLLASVHFDLCRNLIAVAVYGNYESIRKECVTLIGLHINKFEYKGRCMLIRYLMDTANHSGMLGYGITVYKNSINEALQCETAMPDCFVGPQFANMLNKICYLPHGAESDLMELADQIITALNFLRFMTLKDVNNVTGFKECFKSLENFYLRDLRTALTISKAHYELKLRDIQDGRMSERELVTFALKVGGNDLGDIPVETKKEIIISALNAFHLMEGLLARLSECVTVVK